MRIALCGAGAIGSWVGIFLAHPEHELTVYDDDRIESQNIATSAYSHCHIGAHKAVVLAEMMWRKAHARAVPDTSTVKDGKALCDFDLVIDTFDNVEAREYTMAAPYVVHVGVSEDRTGAVMWDDMYTPPQRTFERGYNPVCTNEMGAPILQFTATCAANIIKHFITTGEKISVTTLLPARVVQQG